MSQNLYGCDKIAEKVDHQRERKEYASFDKDVPTESLSPRSLPAEAVDALLRAARSEQNAILRARDEALLALLIYAGLRVQEVCDIQPRDLDLEVALLVRYAA